MSPNNDLDYKILSDRVSEVLSTLPSGIRKKDAIKILTDNIYPIISTSNKAVLDIASNRILTYMRMLFANSSDEYGNYPFTKKNFDKIATIISHLKDNI